MNDDVNDGWNDGITPSKTMTAKWIKTNGRIMNVYPNNGKDFSLEEMQHMVGGHIEVVYPPSAQGAVLVVNEEGKLDGLPINQLASAAYANPDDVIVGDVLLCRKDQIK